MAFQIRQQSKITDQNMRPKRVEAKLFQGVSLQRAALGEVRNTLQPGVKAKHLEQPLKQQQRRQEPGLVGVLLSRYASKENVPAKPAEKRKRSEEEKLKKLEAVEEKAKEKEEEEVEKEEGSSMEVDELAVAFSSQRFLLEDIDAEDTDNPQLVSEYVCGIYNYLRTLEVKSLVEPHFLEGQVITYKMRSILVNWLVQVHHRFTLTQETLFLTVGILDRYLQAERNLPRNKLQLVGVTAMFIASKFEEMFCPEVGDFVYVTDEAYTKKEVLRMEISILKKLQFNISFPLPLHFLRRNSKAGRADSEQHALAKYLMELSMMEYSVCHFKPSLMAAAALCLSIKLLDRGSWNDTLIYHSKYTEGELMPVMCKMAAMIIKNRHSKHQAVKEKYESKKFLKISTIPQLKSDVLTKLAEGSALY